MRKPLLGKPRSASGMFTLARSFPRLKLPISSLETNGARPRPRVGKPSRVALAPLAGSLTHSTLPARRSDGAASGEPVCSRCGHSEDLHPVRYVCDKYPHPDPLQICGCEAATLDEVCAGCGHKAHWHKPRHRCRDKECGCWAFEDA